MKLTNLVQKPREVQEQAAVPKMDEPKYPYGTCITLNEEAIAKFGWKELPKAGTKVTLEAKGTVVMTRNVDGTERKSMSVEIQITDLGVEVGKELKSATDVLYGEKKGLRGA